MLLFFVLKEERTKNSLFRRWWSRTSNKLTTKLHFTWRWCLQVFQSSFTLSAALRAHVTMCFETRSVWKHPCDHCLTFPHDFKHFPCPYSACCKHKQYKPLGQKDTCMFVRLTGLQCKPTDFCFYIITW